MITKLLLTFCIGLAMHRTERWVDYIIKTSGWNQLTKYTLGVTSVFPFVVLLFDDLGECDHIKKITLAYFMAYLFFGMGTAVGYILEAVAGNER